MIKKPLTNPSSIIDSIADHLVADHIALMAENKRLRDVLRELLDEHYPPEHYTDETIEHEMGQGNMAMPMVRRAYGLVGR